MAQFDVYKSPSTKTDRAYPFLVDVQNSVINKLLLASKCGVMCLTRNFKMDLTGSKLKLSRAKSHLEELLEEIKEYISNSEIQFFEEVDDNNDRILKVKLKQTLPTSYSLVVGDIIANIRSSLDYLAVELSKEINGKPKRVYYPFCSSEEEFDVKSRSVFLKNFTREAIHKIKLTEPYKDGDIAFWALNKIRNHDSHNFLLPASSIGAVSLLSNITVENAKVGFMIGMGNDLSNGIPLSNLGTNGTWKFNEGYSEHIRVNVDIVFGNIEYLSLIHI